MANPIKWKSQFDTLENLRLETDRLKVLGSEKIEGKDCWKVEIASIEEESKSTIYWIAKSDKWMLKSSRKVAQLGGAEMITVRK
jgi:hypothetical protein